MFRSRIWFGGTAIAVVTAVALTLPTVASATGVGALSRGHDINQICPACIGLHGQLRLDAGVPS